MEAHEKTKVEVLEVKKLMKLIAGGILSAALPLMAVPMETVGGYSWYYRINGDTAEIQSISPSPTGAVTIPATLGGKPVKSIGGSTFSGCSGLTSVTIPDSVTSIAAYAFSGCRRLTSVTIPASVKSIGSYAFYNCSGLKSVTIPDSVTSIGREAFSGCSGLTSVTIPDSVTGIGWRVFYGCDGLADANGFIIIRNVLCDYQGAGGNVVIPSGVTSIGRAAFYNCSGLTSVTIPDSVTRIGESAFYNCNGLTSVTIPDSVTRIGYEAFCLCSGLTNVTIGSGMTTIDERAFYGCEYIATAYFRGNAPSYYRGNNFGGNTVAVAPRTSSGWGVTIPGTWKGMTIIYDDMRMNWVEQPFSSTGGDADWVPEGDGVWRSGRISAGQSSTAEMFVVGPAAVSFKWKTSSKPCHDYLRFTIDGDYVSEISGVLNHWIPRPHTFADGLEHSLKWTYVKDCAGADGEDCGWIRDIVVMPLAQFIVTLNANGGELSGETKRVVGENMPVGDLPTPTRADHTFLGWFTAAGGQQVTASTVVTGDVTYTARWMANEVSPPVSTSIVQQVEAPYALTDYAADRAIASVTVDEDCAIDSFVLKDGKVYDAMLYVNNVADREVTLSLPDGYSYKTFKGTRPLTIPAKSQCMISITRVADKTFLVSRGDLEDAR